MPSSARAPIVALVALASTLGCGVILGVSDWKDERCVADTSVDPDNCGVCGNHCSPGQVCLHGSCETTCASGTTACGRSCAALASDNQNCGACDAACDVGAACAGGKCVAQCGSGTTACGKACVDTRVDPANCGKCGSACAPGTACVASACTSACPGAEQLCAGDGGSICTDTQSDGQNCGACGSACTQGQVCTAGSCTTDCQPNETLCGVDAGTPYCADTQNDETNCGACGGACGSGAKCVAGACTSQIASCRVVAGLLWCFNPAACGQACTAVCSSLGLAVVSDYASWFAAQNTFGACNAISQAFGVAQSPSVASYPYGCLEDSLGSHTAGGGLLGPIECSTNNACPTQHTTSMDQGGVACGLSSRRSICPCK